MSDVGFDSGPVPRSELGNTEPAHFYFMAFIRTGDINMPMGWRINRVGGRRLAAYKRAPAYVSRPTRAAKKIARKTISKRRKAARAAALARLGERLGTGTAKRYTGSDTTAVAKNTRTLYATNLSVVARNTTANAIDSRNRDVINLRGFKVNLEIKNNGTEPLYFHYAILWNKTADIGTPDTLGFFRGSGNKRAIDFSTSLDALDFHTRGINQDKYLVWKHKKFILNGSGAATAISQSGKNYKQLNMYIPIKRQLRFATDLDSTPISGNVFFVYWADVFMAPVNTVAATNAYSVSMRNVMYFKEVEE